MQLQERANCRRTAVVVVGDGGSIESERNKEDAVDVADKGAIVRVIADDSSAVRDGEVATYVVRISKSLEMKKLKNYIFKNSKSNLRH